MLCVQPEPAASPRSAEEEKKAKREQKKKEGNYLGKLLEKLKTKVSRVERQQAGEQGEGNCYCCI